MYVGITVTLWMNGWSKRADRVAGIDFGEWMVGLRDGEWYWLAVGCVVCCIFHKFYLINY